MTRWNLLTALSVASLAVAIAGSSPAFGRGAADGGGIGGGAFFGRPRALHALDLSAWQAHAVRTVLQSHWPTIRRLAAAEKAAKVAIDDKLAAPGAVTPQDLDTLVREEIDTHSALMRERLSAALEVRDELTPEQIQHVASIRAGVGSLRAASPRLLRSD